MVVPGKHGIPYLMIELKEVKINSEAIPVQMQQVHTETQQMKNINETPTVMVNAYQINETTTLHLPPEEESRQATSEYHDLGYIKRILSSPEEKPIEPKELKNKGYVKPFKQGLLDLDNGLISYYDTPCTVRVRQLRPRLVPIKFKQVLISEFHVSLLAGHIH